jgi:hypothetical protein
MDEHQAM